MNKKEFDIQVKRGEIAEEKLRNILCGKDNLTVEVKRDYKFVKTGNIVIEFESNGTPSGINITLADWWAFSLAVKGKKDRTIIFIELERLKELYFKYKNKPGHSVRGGWLNLSKLVKIPINELLIGY